MATQTDIEESPPGGSRQWNVLMWGAAVLFLILVSLRLPHMDAGDAFREWLKDETAYLWPLWSLWALILGRLQRRNPVKYLESLDKKIAEAALDNLRSRRAQVLATLPNPVPPDPGQLPESSAQAETARL